MRLGVLLVSCVLLGASCGQHSAGVPFGTPARDPVPNDLQPSTDTGLDRIQVVSSALRVTPHRSHPRGKRATVTSWRRPWQHQFVTKEDRASPPAIIRVYPPAPSAASRKAKRIIYYATLPEIVRPPGWYDQRLDYYDARPSSPQQYRQPIYSSYTGYQGYHNKDNEVTRVQSNIIDVTPSRDRDRFSSTPKFTIIDVEPPYNYNYNSYNNYNRYNSYSPPAPSNRYTYPSWQRRPPLNPSYDRPEPSLEPVKLEIPTTQTSNSTDTDNSTRLVPDLSTMPLSIRSSSKFIT